MPPLYEYRCPRCQRGRQDMRTVDARHCAPWCDYCNKCSMELQISPVQGIVKNPAVPREKS